MIDTTTPFAWSRYWYPADSGNLESFCPDGYLALPPEKYHLYYSSIPKQLSDLEQIPVLVLLGDPGSGKSQSLIDEHHRLEANHLVTFCDLKGYGPGDQSALSELLFDANKLSLVDKGQKLWILFDGLDECGIHAAAEWLIRDFVHKVKTPERVYVRIACRASSWPDKLYDALAERWRSTDRDPVRKLRLCPLREEDIRIAAPAYEIDADEYLQAVAEREAVELAAHPVTGKFMLELFRRGDLPPERADIFEKGLRLLSEDSPGRRHSGKKGSVPQQTRFITAQRIALGYILNGSNGIWEGSRLECPPGLFNGHEVLGIDHYEDSQIEVDEAAFTETLTLTGIFTRLGSHRFQFSSRTFAEFLAAHYIAERNNSVDQPLKLLLHAESGRLIPDISETAAWLSALNTPFREWLFTHEPYAALEADMATLGKGNTAALVDGLITIAGLEERPSYDRQRLSRLNHPELANQLARYICDKSRPVASRTLACRIANACAIQTVGHQLADIALDPTEDSYLRELAASVIGDLGNDEIAKRLIPLATESSDPDLRAITLANLGPRLLGANTFFEQLSPIFIEAAPGDLHYVLYDESFFDSLEHSSVLAGLTWITQHPPNLTDEFYSNRLRQGILRKAFEQTDDPEILEGLIDALCWLKQAHYDLFAARTKEEPSTPLDDPNIRRTILSALFGKLQVDDVSRWVYGRENCARDEDIPWLLEQLNQKTSAERRKVIAAFINALVSCDTTIVIVNTILDIAGVAADKRDSDLAQAMSWLVEPADLCDPITMQWKEHYFENQALRKLHEERRSNRRLPRSPQEYVVENVLACEEGRLENWSELIHSLTFKEDGSHSFPVHPDELPGWQAADDVLRCRIATIALAYLQEVPPPADQDLLKNCYGIKERAGGFAFDVLASTNKLDKVLNELWAPWCLALVAHNFHYTERQNLIFALARSAAPKDFDSAVLKVLDQSASEGYVSVLHSVLPIWHPQLQEAISTRLCNESWIFRSRLELAEFLINRGDESVVEQLCEWASSEDEFENRRSAAQLLISIAPNLAWPNVEQIVTGEQEFARAVLLGVSSAIRYEDNISTKLNALQIGWLFDRLSELFPHAEDPPIPNSSYSPTPRMEMSRFRDGMVYRLASLGTPESVKELDRLCSKYSQLTWLIRLKADGYKQLWRQQRSSISFKEATKLLSNSKTTVVRNDRELMRAIEVALKQFAHEAQHGSPPLAVFLWDERQKMHFTEQRLSDFLKFYLEREWRGRQIILNREVEIRNNNPFGVGQRADLFIQATLPGRDADSHQLSVVVEVKCDSNVKDADIPKQLVEQYLDGEKRACGIYLVGHFGGTKAIPLDELQAKIDGIARSSTSESITVSALTIDLSHPRYADKLAITSNS